MAQKQKISDLLVHSERISKMLMYVSIAALVLTPMHLLAAEDSTYDAQIDATQSEVAAYEQEQVRLAQYADTVEVALSQLDAQIADINEQVAINQEKYDALTNELLIREDDVKARSESLGGVLRQSYLDSQVTPLEMLASSKTVSDYMYYYEVRDRVQAQTQESLKVLKSAKIKLISQRDEVKKILLDGKAMQETLSKTRGEQQELLSRTRGQQEAYASLVAERNTNIAELRAEQLGANQTFFVGGEIIEGDPGRGGYPEKLDSAVQDSLVDPWGMYNRECVSYTAWKVHQKTGKMPYWGGRGNANEWPTSAKADGIETGSTPKQGAVAIAFIGPYGHSMYVEEVLEGGKIRVSEYNYFVNGTYTERIINGSGLTYVYFE